MLVSIIIPAYNAAWCLERAVQSTLEQTYPETEIILVDNCSSDGTPEIIEQYTARYPGQVKGTYCTTQGASAARNQGLQLARGEWVQFLDADDTLQASKIAHQLNELQAGVQWIIGGYFNLFPDGSRTTNLPHKDPWRGLVFQYRIGNTSANLFHRDALGAVNGWREDLQIEEDPDLHFRLLQAKTPHQFVPEPLANYHHYPSGDRLSQRDLAKGNSHHLELILAVNKYLRTERPDYWTENKGYFLGAALRSIRILATYDLTRAADVFRRFKADPASEWRRTPYELVPKIYQKAYPIFGFTATEQLRKVIAGVLPASLKQSLKPTV
ncbi:MAG: glycosyltransferase [Bacteroidota bacterium]